MPLFYSFLPFFITSSLLPSLPSTPENGILVSLVFFPLSLCFLSLIYCCVPLRCLVFGLAFRWAKMETDRPPVWLLVLVLVHRVHGYSGYTGSRGTRTHTHTHGWMVVSLLWAVAENKRLLLCLSFFLFLSLSVSHSCHFFRLFPSSSHLLPIFFSTFSNLYVFIASGVVHLYDSCYIAVHIIITILSIFIHVLHCVSFFAIKSSISC